MIWSKVEMAGEFMYDGKIASSLFEEENVSAQDLQKYTATLI